MFGNLSIEFIFSTKSENNQSKAKGSINEALSTNEKLIASPLTNLSILIFDFGVFVMNVIIESTFAFSNTFRPASAIELKLSFNPFLISSPNGLEIHLSGVINTRFPVLLSKLKLKSKKAM